MRRILSFIKSVFLFFAVMFAVLFIYDSLFPPISTLMMARTITMRPVARDYVPIKYISPHLVAAAIAAEDGKFCTHHGIDWESLHDVVKDKLEDGDESRGASTITMQVVKNLFLSNSRSVIRKAVELPMALALDLVWSKRHIMQSYLNVAEFGRGVFGAQAAAKRYFGKSASALTPREAALLAATLPNPKKRNPARPSSYMQGYAGTIQARMTQVETRCTR
jgi:monofunctional biosynthetic peptidoglycan transglycosylase